MHTEPFHTIIWVSAYIVCIVLVVLIARKDII
jgi:hypothetical protein